MFYLADFKRKFEKEVMSLKDTQELRAGNRTNLEDYLKNSNSGKKRRTVFTAKDFKEDIGKVREDVKRYNPYIAARKKEVIEKKANKYSVDSEIRSIRQRQRELLDSATNTNTRSYTDPTPEELLESKRRKLDRKRNKQIQDAINEEKLDKRNRLNKAKPSRKRTISQKVKTKKSNTFGINTSAKKIKKRKLGEYATNQNVQNFWKGYVNTFINKDKSPKYSQKGKRKLIVGSKNIKGTKKGLIYRGQKTTQPEFLPQKPKAQEGLKNYANSVSKSSDTFLNPDKVVSSTPKKVGMKLGTKIGLGVLGTGLALGGLYGAKKLRDARSDKGKKRGKYNR